MNKVTVYTKDYCPYCTAAKKLLTERGIPFDEVHVDPTKFDEWQALQKRSGMKTVPQIFFGDTLIGGYTELAALDSKDGLASIKSS